LSEENIAGKILICPNAKMKDVGRAFD